MLLLKLREYADRVPEEDTSPPLYERKPVRYEVRLRTDGSPARIIPLSGGGKRDLGLPMFMPAVVRSSGVRPKLLADTAEYALGWGREDRARRYHEAFIELVRACAQDVREPAVDAVLRYLELPDEQRAPRPADFETERNVTFSVDGVFPIDLPSVRAWWAAYADRSAGAGDANTQCLVCGQFKPIVDRLPFPIKGLSGIGGQPSGSALISANASAFESFGLSANYTAPTCAECAEKFCKALNTLIAGEDTRLYLGPLLYVFWTREPTTYRFGSTVAEPTAQNVAELLTAARKARTGAQDLDPNHFYCVSLAGSGGRVAVRDWIDVTLTEAQANLARYFAAQHIVNRSGVAGEYIGIKQLIRTLEPPGKGDVAPSVPRLLMRAALHGDPLPTWLLAQTLRRIHAEQGAVGHPRAALIKLVLATNDERGIYQQRNLDALEAYMSGLDPENRSAPYLCGRLLAVLDSIQRAALGQRNATIIDRFFGAASTAPVSVFGRLVRGAQPHLAKMRRDRPGAYVALESRLQEILAGIDTFPRTLSINQQGEFVLGYYHQRAHDIAQAMQRRAARGASEPALAEASDDEFELEG
ncbi:MAG: type I-C CRISPR-associated protein Cas8c/Csd1 [Chloroflexi bacterium]|nr:MAG: type I-C CRISPR-associated protein Cas8c/Csd1 [Chloroflexota bacterium]